jgi:hypothetical protein
MQEQLEVQDLSGSNQRGTFPTIAASDEMGESAGAVQVSPGITRKPQKKRGQR